MFQYLAGHEPPLKKAKHEIIRHVAQSLRPMITGHQGCVPEGYQHRITLFAVSELGVFEAPIVTEYLPDPEVKSEWSFKKKKGKGVERQRLFELTQAGTLSGLHDQAVASETLRDTVHLLQKIVKRKRSESFWVNEIFIFILFWVGQANEF